MSEEVNYNLLTKSRWVAIIPTKFLGAEGDSDIIFNLQDTVIPELGQYSASVSVGGYPIDIPAHARDIRKNMKFSYLLDSNMTQYKFLYKWYNTITNESGMGTTAESMADYTIPIRVAFLTEYKNVVTTFLFENCWLKGIEGISLDYTGDDRPIKHSFTVSYSHLTIE